VVVGDGGHEDPMQARQAEEMLPCPGFALPAIGDNDGRPLLTTEKPRFFWRFGRSSPPPPINLRITLILFPQRNPGLLDRATRAIEDRAQIARSSHDLTPKCGGAPSVGITEEENAPNPESAKGADGVPAHPAS
jgi:hypothetical protein